MELTVEPKDSDDNADPVNDTTGMEVLELLPAGTKGGTIPFLNDGLTRVL